MVTRGDIFYVNRMDDQYGSEQIAGRPAIIVSNDGNNANSSVVEIVYLTTQKKPDLATHVQIQSSGRISTAICEQIHAISTAKLGQYIGRVTSHEMAELDAALAISIGLYYPEDAECGEDYEKRFVMECEEEISDLSRRIVDAEAQAKVYKQAFDDLLKAMTKSA